MTQAAIGIDLGCTYIKAVLIDAEGTILLRRRHETREQDCNHWQQAIAQIVRDFSKEKTGNVPIGLCAPGLADANNTFIECMPSRLPGLERFDWSKLTGQRVYVLNDAHAAMTAEASFGAGKGLNHIVMITLGSGVGGGILIGGKLYQGMGQMAGHFGHITVNADAVGRDITNMPGSIEEAIGNITILERSYGRFTSTFELIDAYRRGDAFASWLWLDSVRKLAVSLASVINLISPEAIIVGGGISQAGDALMKPLEAFLDLYEWRPAEKKTSILTAQFSDMAGALGAAAFALSKTDDK